MFTFNINQAIQLAKLNGGLLELKKRVDAEIQALELELGMIQGEQTVSAPEPAALPAAVFTSGVLPKKRGRKPKAVTDTVSKPLTAEHKKNMSAAQQARWNSKKEEEAKRMTGQIPPEFPHPADPHDQASGIDSQSRLVDEMIASMSTSGKPV